MWLGRAGGKGRGMSEWPSSEGCVLYCDSLVRFNSALAGHYMSQHGSLIYIGPHASTSMNLIYRPMAEQSTGQGSII